MCDRCVRELEASHATVALASGDGLWAPAYATDTTAADLDQQAFTMGEGPCYDALQSHAPVLVVDLESRFHRDRWPAWSTVALSTGVRSVAALPVQSGAIVAGVLTMFSDTNGSLHGRRLAAALRLADTALLGLLDVLAGLDAGADGRADSAALADGRPSELADVVRAEVHQAAGMITVQAGIPIVQALARLRARAFQAGRPVTEVAADVLARRLSFAPDGNSAE